MNFDNFIKRQLIISEIILNDPDFNGEVLQTIITINDTGALEELLKDIKLSNKIKSNMYNNGVEK